MTCREIEQLLTEALDCARANPEVASHLESCQACRTLSRELEEIEDLKISLGRRASAPADLPFRVSREYSRSRTRRFLWQVALPLVGVVLVTAAARYLETSTTEVASPLRVGQERLLQSTNGREAAWNPALETEPLQSRQPRYFDVLLPNAAEGPVIVRLPTTIEVYRSDPGRDYLAYVSH